MLVEKIVHIASAHRDRKVYPNPAHYVVTLPGDPGEYKRSVCGVKMLSATFPKTHPIFTDHNRFLDLETQQTAGVTTLEIPRGNYGISDVIDHLNTAYAEIVYCRAIVATGTFVIGAASDDNPIRLLFETGPSRARSAHKVLGFPTLDSADFALEHFGVMHANLDSSPYVDVLVDELPSAALQQTVDGPVFARVPLDNPNFTSKHWINEQQHDPGQHGASLFHPTYLPRITLRLRNAYGAPYDTFGFDHMWTLRVLYLVPDLPSSLGIRPFDATPRTHLPFVTDPRHGDGDVVDQSEGEFPYHSTEGSGGGGGGSSSKKKRVLRNAAIGLGTMGGAYLMWTRANARATSRLLLGGGGGGGGYY